MHHRRSLPAAVALVLALVLAGCGSDGDDAADETTTTSTASDDTSTSGSEPAEEPTIAGFAERGPYGVGSLALDLDGRRVVVWYPAEEGAGTEEPTDTFDIASLLSPELQAQIPAESRVQYPVPAAAGAEPATDGPFPIVLFSHGFAGFPEQSVDLTTHLASWGYVVAAPDHVERSLSGLLGTAAQGVTPSTDPEVLGATLDLVLAEADEASSPLAGLVDPETVAVAGHSAGAGAAYRTAATDDRIDAVASYSLGAGSAERPLGDAPTVPALVMAGVDDATIPVEATREAFDTLSPPRYLVEIEQSGHLVFSDLCLIGAEQGGLVGIVEEIGLEVPADLLQLASDGCGEEALEVTEAFPVVDGVSVAFLRTYLDGDEEAASALVDGPIEVDSTVEATLTADP